MANDAKSLALAYRTDTDALSAARGVSSRSPRGLSILSLAPSPLDRADASPSADRDGRVESLASGMAPLRAMYCSEAPVWMMKRQRQPETRFGGFKFTLTLFHPIARDRLWSSTRAGPSFDDTAERALSLGIHCKSPLILSTY